MDGRVDHLLLGDDAGDNVAEEDRIGLRYSSPSISRPEAEQLELGDDVGQPAAADSIDGRAALAGRTGVSVVKGRGRAHSPNLRASAIMARAAAAAAPPLVEICCDRRSQACSSFLHRQDAAEGEAVGDGEIHQGA